jgi:hypothetical protein
MMMVININEQFLYTYDLFLCSAFSLVCIFLSFTITVHIVFLCHSLA